jgi:hypothetical protein
MKAASQSLKQSSKLSSWQPAIPKYQWAHNQPFSQQPANESANNPLNQPAIYVHSPSHSVTKSATTDLVTGYLVTQPAGSQSVSHSAIHKIYE